MATGDAEYEQIDDRGIAPTPTHTLAFEGGPFVSVLMGEGEGLVVLVSGTVGDSDEYTGPVRLNVNAYSPDSKSPSMQSVRSGTSMHPRTRLHPVPSTPSRSNSTPRLGRTY